jgi:hypothetical protein
MDHVEQAGPDAGNENEDDQQNDRGLEQEWLLFRRA